MVSPIKSDGDVTNIDVAASAACKNGCQDQLALSHQVSLNHRASSPAPAVISYHPFQRRKSSGNEECYDERTKSQLLGIMQSLEECTGEKSPEQMIVELNDARAPVSDDLLKAVLDEYAARWKLKDEFSEIAFRGMLLVLEYCLGFDLKNHAAFNHFIESLGFHTVFFWKKAVPLIYDSDMQYGTNYREALLFSLVLYDVNYGRNRLRELFAAVPGLRDSLLGKPAKRFEEAFHHVVLRRTFSSINDCGTSTRDSELDSLPAEDWENDSPLDGDVDDVISSSDRDTRGSRTMDSEEGAPEFVLSEGLVTGHFSERVINVSNAPPVSLNRRKDSGQWEIGQGSGGLVSCCAPVMNQDPDNVWLACFGPNVPISSSRAESPLPAPPTNSLGLPLLRRSTAEVHANILQDPNRDFDGVQPGVAEALSLLNVLRDYSKGNFQLNPVVVADEDYNTYYGGISNGLLWPVLHNLPEYILKEYYDDTDLLEDHWRAYIRVNYQFALNAVRNSRPQDFLWIHDYHLLLVGLIIQSLDPNLEVGFFLHIPFQPPEVFFDSQFGKIGYAVLRGLLRFTKVGFQTFKDRATFVDLVKQHLSSAKFIHDLKQDKIHVRQDGWGSSLGVFPVSIKTDEYLDLARDPDIMTKSENVRSELMGDRKGKLFVGVERFDYTKGIREKLMAFKVYLEKHPERWGMDVLFQVAVTNRRSVETYKNYQDECFALVKDINDQVKLPSDPSWVPVIFQTSGLLRPDLVAHYLAMDVGVVTPRKDGMNLVAKEMVLCNPHAALMLSTGAGTEQQLNCAGFYNQDRKCYFRVNDVYNVDEFADVFAAAAAQEQQEAITNSKILFEFLMAHDIEKWSQAFLDPSWSHEVIPVNEITSLPDFYNLMFCSRDVRRKITENVLKGIPIRAKFKVSLHHAKESLLKSIKPGSTTLVLRPGSSEEEPIRKHANMDVANEIEELEQDLAFLDYVESGEYDNIEKFLGRLAPYHPISRDAYSREISEAINLITHGDHFQYFFTDRDGTLKSYSCSYPSSIQPTYSGVIQAQFARRCVQYAVIVTSAPLLNVGILDVQVMPDGYYSIGASGGREWYIDASKKFNDTSVSDAERELLDRMAEQICSLMTMRRYMVFRWIGSGIQRHYDRITVAKNDCYRTLGEDLVTEWTKKIYNLVSQYDVEEKLFHIHETDTDIRIQATSESGKVFTKGHGVALFASAMHADLNEGNILICGDSETDLPMLEHALSVNPENTYSIWVTQDEALQAMVTAACERHSNKYYVFVSCPAVILGAMALATIREIKLRPVDLDILSGS